MLHKAESDKQNRSIPEPYETEPPNDHRSSVPSSELPAIRPLDYLPILDLPAVTEVSLVEAVGQDSAGEQSQHLPERPDSGAKVEIGVGSTEADEVERIGLTPLQFYLFRAEIVQNKLQHKHE